MSTESLETEPRESEEVIGEEDWKEGEKKLKQYKNSALEKGNCGPWAVLAAEINTISPNKAGEMGIATDEDIEKAVKKDLDKRKEAALKDNDWYPYLSLAANVKRSGLQVDIKDKEVEQGIMSQLEELKSKASGGNLEHYVDLLSKYTVINPNGSLKPGGPEKDAIIKDVFKRNSAGDLSYAANTRIIFRELSAADLGVDAGVLNEVNNNAENYGHGGFSENIDNLLKLKANERIVTAEKVEIK